MVTSISFFLLPFSYYLLPQTDIFLKGEIVKWKRFGSLGNRTTFASCIFHRSINSLHPLLTNTGTILKIFQLRC